MLIAPFVKIPAWLDDSKVTSALFSINPGEIMLLDPVAKMVELPAEPVSSQRLELLIVNALSNASRLPLTVLLPETSIVVFPVCIVMFRLLEL